MPDPAFEYTLRESPRARNVRFRVSARDGLVVVVPRGFPVSRVPALLQTRQRWIERAMHRVEAQLAYRAAQLATGAPTRLRLRAIGEEWDVEYRHTDALRVTVREHADGRVVVSGDVSNEAATRAAMRRWLARRAKTTLVPVLMGMADEHGYLVSKATMRWQRSRWGSCSAKGTISLNTQLLFLPAPVMRYVLLHELCHTAQMDHSAAFWALVASHEPGYREHKVELREGWSKVPAWLQVDEAY